jgi:excisionase family DNA binding protein
VSARAIEGSDPLGLRLQLPASRADAATEVCGGRVVDDRRGSVPAPVASVPVGEKFALSVEEAGALLGISRDLAYDLVARRELPSVRLGRRIVVPRRALEEALLRLIEEG